MLELTRAAYGRPDTAAGYIMSEVDRQAQGPVIKNGLDAENLLGAIEPAKLAKATSEQDY